MVKIFFLNPVWFLVQLGAYLILLMLKHMQPKKENLTPADGEEIRMILNARTQLWTNVYKKIFV